MPVTHLSSAECWAEGLEKTGSFLLMLVNYFFVLAHVWAFPLSLTLLQVNSGPDLHLAFSLSIHFPLLGLSAFFLHIPFHPSRFLFLSAEVNPLLVFSSKIWKLQTLLDVINVKRLCFCSLCQ